jgi:Rrf2 family iron-sulfur cluster assembly transcriptional regulator
VQFGTSIEYAIHSLIYMANKGQRARSSRPEAGRAPVFVGDIARAIKVPESYLRKVMQHLARAGLVASHRGVKGGFSLTQEPGSITLQDVVEAIDGSLPTWCCVKEKKQCGGAPCPVSAAFEEARQKMAESLARTSIGDLASRVGRRPDRWLAVTSCP